MTLIVTTLSDETVVQAVDRRITSGGVLYDDFANKALCAVCADATFTLAYAGLMFRPKRTDVWLLDYLLKSGCLARSFPEVSEAIRVGLTAEIGRFDALPPENRRLTVALAGFGKRGPFAARISNCEDDRGKGVSEPHPEFVCRFALRNERRMTRLDMMFVGAEAAIDKPLIRAIQKIRRRYFGKPGSEIAKALVAVIRRASQNRPAGHLISPNCLSTVYNRRDLSNLVDDHRVGEHRKSCLPHFVTAFGAHKHPWIAWE